MLDYSRKFKTECNKAKLDPPIRAMAELMVQGWSPQDAFIAVGLNKPALSDEYNKQQIEKHITDPEFTVYMESRRKAIKRGILKQYEPDTEEDTERTQVKLLSKEEVLQEALQTAMLLPKNDPKRVDVLMRFADLAQMKREEIKEEEQLIHYYLPLTCNNCSLYLASKKKKGEC